MNVLSMLRSISILSIFVAAVLFVGCATDEGLTIDGRPALGEPTPPPPPGPRGGWAW